MSTRPKTVRAGASEGRLVRATAFASANQGALAVVYLASDAAGIFHGS
jgi:lipid-binding SYLF domain-containing protein